MYLKIDSNYEKIPLPDWLIVDRGKATRLNVKWISSDGGYICLDIKSENELSVIFRITFSDYDGDPRKLLGSLNYIGDFVENENIEGKIFSIKIVPPSKFDLRYLIERSIENQGDLTISGILEDQDLPLYREKSKSAKVNKIIKMIKAWSITSIIILSSLVFILSYFFVTTSHDGNIVAVVGSDAIIKDFTTPDLEVLVNDGDKVNSNQIIAKVSSKGGDLESQIKTNSSIIESKKTELLALNSSLKSSGSEAEKNKFRASISKVESSIAELRGKIEILKKGQSIENNFQSGCDCIVYNKEGAIITLIPNDSKQFIEVAFNRTEVSRLLYDGKDIYFRFDGGKNQKGVLKKIHKNQNKRIGLDSKFWNDTKYDVYYIIPESEIKGGVDIIGKPVFVIISSYWNVISNMIF